MYPGMQVVVLPQVSQLIITLEAWLTWHAFDISWLVVYALQACRGKPSLMMKMYPYITYYKTKQIVVSLDRCDHSMNEWQKVGLARKITLKTQSYTLLSIGTHI